MKTWKQNIIGIVAITVLFFTACDKKDPCACPNGTVHYDTPCACAGIGNDCHCTVEYKPALDSVFDFTDQSAIDGAVEGKVGAAFDAIWASGVEGKQLLMALAAKAGTIRVMWVNSGSGVFYASGMLLIMESTIDDADFVDQLKAKLIDAKNDTTFV